MTNNNMGIILAAGNSRRMNSAISKVFHDLCGRPIVQHVMALLHDMDVHDITIVASPHNAQHPCYEKARVCIQESAKGTGDAVRAAFENAFKVPDAMIDAVNPTAVEYVYIACGDAPLFVKQNLMPLINSAADIAFAVAQLPPHLLQEPYGRVMYDGASGMPVRICEYKDADDQMKQNPWINAGFYKIKKSVLESLLPEITNNNAVGEYYLTDIVALGAHHHRHIESVEIPFDDTIGVNTRQDLQRATSILQRRYHDMHRSNGVTMIDPATVHLSFDTVIGQDSIVEPNVFMGPGVRMCDRVHIKSFSYLGDCYLEDDVEVGPFAHVRGHSVMREKSAIGNFVELKNTVFEKSAKAKHLSYLGDAVVGVKSNIGAGTITANYDGYFKHKTVIGEGAHIGANTVFVAPVHVGANAMTAAGTVVTHDVEAGALGLGRAPLVIKQGWVDRYRSMMRQRKNDNAKDQK